MASKPLQGVRILDLTRLLPGPVATLHLADLGADVIKIEDHGAGDYARAMGAGPEGVSVFYRAVNRNKRGLRLDLKHPEGAALFRRLAAEVDVVVESFRPGVMDKLGVGYETLRHLNPRLVFCAITGYGQSGPLAQAAGHDLNYIGYAGILDQIGVDGGQPAIPNLQIGDLLGGAMGAVMGILAALFDARRSGEGRFVDVSMSDAALAHNLFPLFALQGGGAVPERGGDMLTGGDAGYGVYATADGRYMAVAPLERKFWDLFCDTLGQPRWKARHGAAGAEARAMRKELEALFASQPQSYWTEKFARVDCCVTPVLTVAEALAHPHFQTRGMSLQGDGITQYGPPVRFSGMPSEPVRPAPAPGEHGEAILAEFGVTAEERQVLRQLDVV